MADLRRRLKMAGPATSAAAPEKAPRRSMSAAARRRIAAAQKKRWAAYRKGKKAK